MPDLIPSHHRTSLAPLPIFAGAVASLLFLAPVQPASAGDNLIVKPSQRSVKETIDTLATALEKKGIKIVARVDHAAGAKDAGLDLSPSELIIFGNPKLGTPLMQANPEIGLDLPMKVLVWQDKDGKVRIAYTDPAILAARYGITGRDDVIEKMTKALDGLSSAAAGTAKSP